MRRNKGWLALRRFPECSLRRWSCSSDFPIWCRCCRMSGWRRHNCRSSWQCEETFDCLGLHVANEQRTVSQRQQRKSGDPLWLRSGISFTLLTSCLSGFLSSPLLTSLRLVSLLLSSPLFLILQTTSENEECSGNRRNLFSWCECRRRGCSLRNVAMTIWSVFTAISIRGRKPDKCLSHHKQWLTVSGHVIWCDLGNLQDGDLDGDRKKCDKNMRCN